MMTDHNSIKAATRYLDTKMNERIKADAKRRDNVDFIMMTATILLLVAFLGWLMPTVAHGAEPTGNVYRAFERMVDTVGNDTFVASDYGVEHIRFHIVNPKPVIDTATPVIAISVVSYPDVDCDNIRFVIDVDRWCALAVYCDWDGEGTASLTVGGGCD